MTFLLPTFQFGWLYFSCLIALSRTSNTMLNKSEKNRHSRLIPDLGRNAFSLSMLSMVLTVGLSYIMFAMLRHIPSIFTLLKVFNHEWILNCVEYFFCIIEMIIWFLFFILRQWNTLPDLQILTHPYIPRINPPYSCFMIFLMHCWIWLAIFCWGF